MTDFIDSRATYNDENTYIIKDFPSRTAVLMSYEDGELATLDVMTANVTLPGDTISKAYARKLIALHLLGE
jgi:hypothetical protein